MIRLLLVACLLFVNNAYAGYVTVTGRGKSFEEARQQAFRKAIEFKLGATVLSDVETKNYRRIKDEIYIYSAGYVDDYKIINQDIQNNVIILLMEVLVSENKLKNRIISEGKSSTNFDNERHTAQVNTFLQERIAADALLAKHLAHYPKKAYTIKQNPYNITIDEYRNPVLNIPYQLSWNYAYLKTFREILDKIHHGDPGWGKNSASAVVIMAKDPKDWVLGERTVHRFDDVSVVNQLHNTINGPSQVRIIVRLKDLYNNDVYSVCYVPRFISGASGSFYDVGEPRVKTIFGNTKEDSVIRLPVSIAVIDKTSKIELSIDSDFVCKR